MTKDSNPIDDIDTQQYIAITTPNTCPSLQVCVDDSSFIERRYELQVDPLQFDRATEIKPWSFARPHMRIFHVSWMSTFPGVFALFSIPPLMPVIKQQLNLSHSDTLNSDIASVTSAFFSRLLIGPLLEIYGPQVVHAWILWLCAIPVAASAFVTSATGVIIVRFFIGFVGCIFISSQYWTMVTFAKNVIATSNAVTGGLGPSGVGFAFLFLPYLNEWLVSAGLSVDTAWRVTIAFPAVMMFGMGAVVRYCSDACPMGDYQHFRQAQKDTYTPSHTIHNEQPGFIAAMKRLSKSFRIVLADRNTFILMMHYGMATGAELQLNNMGALYFYEDFKKTNCVVTETEDCHVLSKRRAAVIASTFGLMSIISRSVGGMISDYANKKFGFRGRLWIHFSILMFEGVMVLVLSRARQLGVGVAVYMLVAFAAQSGGATTFGIVPYVSETYSGTVSGLVGAGGNIGGVIFGIIFRSTNSRADGYLIVGCIMVAVSLTVPLLSIRKYS